MKKLIKILSLILSLSLLFSSCGKISTTDTAEKIGSYLEMSDYSACKSYLSGLDKDTKAKYSAEALSLISEKFDEIYTPYKENDIFDITLANKAFLENSVKLWSIASEFTPDGEIEFNDNLLYLRYFAEISDYIQYKELFTMLKNMADCGYFYTLQKALNDYDVLGEYELFDVQKKIAAEFKYSNYNPQEYYISEMRAACEKINKHLTSVSNGFATNDTTVIASAINNIYDIASTFLYACDCAETIYSAMNDTMNTLRLQGAFAQYKKEINFSSQRKYTSGMDFPLSFLSEVYSPDDSNSNENENQNSTQAELSKADAIRITVNAINKTKAYKSEITVNRVQNVNIQMSAFKTESEIASTVSLVRVKINDALKKSNGSGSGSRHFVNGVSDNVKLNDVVPPSGHSASLDPALVESYTAVKGSGGYVITFNLHACTSTDSNTSYSLLSIVDGFYFDGAGTGIKHKTFYGPTSISLIVNNQGLLSKYDYTISGVADCKFTEKGEQVATGEFTFKQQYNYGFVY